MDWKERRTKLEALPEREKRILQLARGISNNLLFASQNTGRIAEERYQEKAENCLRELEDLLLYAPKDSPICVGVGSIYSGCVISCP